jgi:Schlafen, AlbA_2
MSGNTEWDPFSTELLSKLFKVSASKPGLICSRESQTLEFKESFGWGSIAEYLKTSASFANNKGGYILFGVKDKPRKLMGLRDGNLKNFEELETEKMTKHFNDNFSPSIHWKQFTFLFKRKNFGLLYIHEATEKPVICKKNQKKELKEGEIYYRYSGRSEKIQYAELKSIIEQEKSKERKFWEKLFSNAGKVGVQNVGLLNLVDGKISGPSGTVMISEDILEKIKFIKEGQFTETNGEPVLQIVGDVRPVSSIPILKKHPTSIRTEHIITEFLKQTKIESPLEYIEQICFETSVYLPIHHYIKLSKLSIGDIIDTINNTKTSASKKKLLSARLHAKKDLSLVLKRTKSKTSKLKQEYYQNILSDTDIRNTKDIDSLKYCMQAIRGIDATGIRLHKNYILKLLLWVFEEHYYTQESAFKSNVRMAVCWVDESLNNS